jgi:hypothetical protein
MIFAYNMNILTVVEKSEYNNIVCMNCHRQKKLTNLRLDRQCLCLQILQLFIQFNYDANDGNRIDVENKMKFPSGNAEVTVGSNTKPQ